MRGYALAEFAPEAEVSPLATARIAIVHPWIIHVRGGEKVFFELARMLPSADLFALRFDAKALPADVRGRGVQGSFLQREPMRRVPYRTLLPLLAHAAESLNLKDYDIVISSSSGWTHGVIVGDHCRHVSYMHSPPRYLWSEDVSSIAGRAGQVLLTPLLHRLRMWDQLASDRVADFVANSATTRTKILCRYRREAEIIHPSVELHRFTEARFSREPYVLALGELVPYKRFDLAIEACRRAKLPLVIVGDGPERARLERQAEGADVTFAGRVSDREVVRHIAAARVFLHPGVEDFGITTVEALAAGTPVVGSAQGGTNEIVAPGCGDVVREQDPDSYAEALVRIHGAPIDRDVLRARAADFSSDAFRIRMIDLLVRATGAG